MSLLVLSAPIVCAQGPSASDAVGQDLRRQYNQVKGYLTRAAEKMPADKYNFKATPAVRTFGAWVADVADSQISLCSAIAGSPKDLKAGSMVNKAELQAALKQSFDSCDAVYNGLTLANSGDQVASWSGKGPRVGVLSMNISHNNECYGAMAVYLRLNNLVPPSSEPKK